MSDEKEVANIKVAAGRRTYFIDVKQTIEGTHYLTISESKRLGKEEYERHRIMLFEEDVSNVIEALQSALPYFPAYKKPEFKSKMELTKERYANAYKPWTEEDDIRLTELFCQGKKSKELSETFERNAGAIRSRIEKLELKEKYG